MLGFRRMLRAVAIVLFSCQVIGLTASPVALCLEVSRASTDAECTCGHGGDHAMCPMHQTTPAPSGSKSDCSCKSTADPNAAVLAAIVGPSAIITERTVFDVLRLASSVDLPATRHLQSPSLTPDGPPPRF